LVKLITIHNTSRVLKNSILDVLWLALDPILILS